VQVLILIVQGQTLIQDEVSLKVFIRIVFGVKTSNSDAKLLLLGCVIFEYVALRHVNNRIWVVVKDHTICVDLLYRLHALAIPIGKFLIKGVLSDSRELQHPLFDLG